MLILKILLYPFSMLYGGIMRLRNSLFNANILSAFQYDDICTINVGNITVGGTGKTPTVEYIVNLLKGQYNVATLSRGYGRKTRGFLLASPTQNAESLGDEPYQLYRKFKSDINVAVGEDRVLAVSNLLAEQPDRQVIVLDDAYQHRYIQPDINMLVTDYNKLFYKDLILPAGRLREPRRAARRAHSVLVTKCPDSLKVYHMDDMVKAIRKAAGKTDLPVYFAGIQYLAPEPVFEGETPYGGQKVILVTGIAQPALVKAYVEKHFHLVSHIHFADHHNYKCEDIKQLLLKVNGQGGTAILTTEKDMVKWLKPEVAKMLDGYPVYYLPISLKILRDKDNFEAQILNQVQAKLQH